MSREKYFCFRQRKTSKDFIYLQLKEFPISDRRLICAACIKNGIPVYIYRRYIVDTYLIYIGIYINIIFTEAVQVRRRYDIRNVPSRFNTAWPLRKLNVRTLRLGYLALSPLTVSTGFFSSPVCFVRCRSTASTRQFRRSVERRDWLLRRNEPVNRSTKWIIPLDAFVAINRVSFFRARSKPVQFRFVRL